MNSFFNRCVTRIKQSSLAVLATAVILSGMGPIPDSVAIAPLSLNPFETEQIPPVAAVPWAGVGTLADPLTSPEVAGSRRKQGQRHRGGCCQASRAAFRRREACCLACGSAGRFG